VNDNLEFSYICSQIASHAGPIRRIHVIEPANVPFTFNGRHVVAGGDEFNIPTTSINVSTPNAVRTALQTVFDRESLLACDAQHTPEGVLSGGGQRITITRSGHGEPVIPSPDTLVIDMSVLLKVVAPVKPQWHAPGPLTTAAAPSPGAPRRE
jgi:hypothetical protein